MVNLLEQIQDLLLFSSLVQHYRNSNAIAINTNGLTFFDSELNENLMT